MTLLTGMEYLCHKWPRICSTCRKHFPHSWLITEFVTILTRRVPLVEQEQLTLPEHLSSPPVFRGVRVIRSLALYICFVDRCLSFCTFSFGYCVVCSSIYGSWLPLWYFQTLLKIIHRNSCSFKIEFFSHLYTDNMRILIWKYKELDELNKILMFTL
jgi:hypothetical protein